MTAGSYSQRMPGLTRREFLSAGLTAGLSSSWLGGCGKSSTRRKYNVVLISLDTLRADRLACHGCTRARTPHIDRLAAQGHRFARAYTTMPTTLPAHASLFTSLYPRQLSVQRNSDRIPEEATFLSEILRAEGWATGGFVSAMVLNQTLGMSRGFDVYDDLGAGIERRATGTLQSALPWLRTHHAEPFFLFAHFYDPHTPYLAPKAFQERFGVTGRSYPPASGFVENREPFTDDVIQRCIAAYDAEIAYTDQVTGRLLGALEELGVADDTLVILLSDHGESLDELLLPYGYAFDHGEFLLAHQLHVPLIFRLPKSLSSGAGSVHTAPVSLVDVLPTVLGTLGLNPPALAMGRSLLPAMQGEGLRSRAVFAERRGFQEPTRPLLAGESCAIIEGSRQYIHSTERQPELYDLGAGPGGMLVLTSHREETADLAGKLQRLVARLDPLFGPSIQGLDEEALKRLRSLGYTD